jgi:flavin-dependent dehydrogenase
MLLTDTAPVRIEGGPGEWSLGLRGDQTGGGRTLHAQFLVDATGRAAWLARWMGQLPHRHDCLIGIHGLVVAPDRTREISHALWIEASENGWWYSAPLRSDDLVVVYMTDADLLAGHSGGPNAVWRQRLREAPRTLERLRGLDLPAKVRVAPAQSQRLARVFGRGWAAVGDAACAFDPLSPSGIRKALEDGVRAASAVAAAGEVLRLLGIRGGVHPWVDVRTGSAAPAQAQRSTPWGRGYRPRCAPVKPSPP